MRCHLIILVLSVTTCKNNTHQTNVSGEREIKTKTGKTVLIRELHPDGESLSNLEIKTEGLHADTIMELEGIDPVQDIVRADLDADGFDEIYIFTKSSGSGSAGEIYGYAFIKDARFAQLQIPGIDEKEMVTGRKFDGYMGHDSLYISGKSLLRTFPVYNEGDANCCPKGGKRTVKYILRNDSLMVE